MVQKYIKRPVVIEAIQYDGNNQEAITAFCLDANGNQNVTFSDWNQAGVMTIEGFKDLPVGYWVIKGIKGEYYPCEPEIFDLTYDRYEEIEG